MGKKICFIGHREIPSQSVKMRLRNVIVEEIKDGCNNFIVGTHGEFDNLALVLCREMKKEYKDIKIEIMFTSISLLNKTGRLYEEDKVFYENEEKHYKQRIITSNKQMIDGCTTLICYVNEKRKNGGAKIAMDYARKQGKEINNIYKEEDEPLFGMNEKEKEEYIKEIRRKLKELKE